MFDIDFVKKSAELKRAIVTKKFKGNALEELNKLRPQSPPVFQLETTNVCNMRCVMCPRTDLMERKQGYMTTDEFGKLVDQLAPHDTDKWKQWKEYSEREFLSKTLAYEEDYFYFFICAQTLILHGFGEPILDKTLAEKIALANEKGLSTYFSMNPVNIKLDKMKEFAEAGLDYLKFSLEGLDNETQLMYRRVVDKDFNATLKKIFDTIELFEKGKYKTKVILTRLSFKNDPEGDREYLDFWKQYPVMVYIKNQHNRWLYEEEKADSNTAEYMQRYCEFPWSSVSVLYDGTVVPCPLDYEGELNMGNVKENTLEEIWNSEKFEDFRQMHANGNFPEGHFCKSKCDYNQLYEFTGTNGSV
jgi:radical SAM protein with 4Fe4S-binding SPASM domain